ncbi:O-antigen ligase family protein [Maribacter sp. 2307ULW6-5]|uniref:O-antigen ligase family protein n=1 Tax=Maribacter sp. 2307ULW6-5 TaxID=3386275 RepID=UPI0039BD41CF
MKDYVHLLKHTDIIGLGLLLLFLLNPFSLNIYIGYVLVLYFIAVRTKSLAIEFDATALVLLVFSVVYTLFEYQLYPLKNKQFLIIQTAFPMFFYLFGKRLLTSKHSQKQALLLLLLLGLTYSLSAVATILADLQKGGFAQVNRDFKYIWDGTRILATGLAGFLIYNITFPSLILSKNKLINPLERAVLAGVYLLTIICSFRLGSRTLIALTVMALLFAVLYQIIVLQGKEKFRFVGALLVLGFVVVNFVEIDLKADYFSTLGSRLSEGTSSNESAGGRTQLWSHAFEKMFEFPLGWISNEYAHNMWLDTAKDAGTLAFFFLVIFTVIAIKNTLRVLRVGQIDISLKLTLALFTLMSLIYFFVEPILKGNPYMFFFFCLLTGLLKKTLELYGVPAQEQQHRRRGANAAGPAQGLPKRAPETQRN